MNVKTTVCLVCRSGYPVGGYHPLGARYILFYLALYHCHSMLTIPHSHINMANNIWHFAMTDQMFRYYNRQYDIISYTRWLFN